MSKPVSYIFTDIIKIVCGRFKVCVNTYFSVLCYEQTCRKYDGVWNCENAREGKEVNLKDRQDLYCTELHYGTERVIYRKYSSKDMFWYSDANFTTQLNQTGYACDHTFCFCKRKLCNNRVKVPVDYSLEESSEDYDL